MNRLFLFNPENDIALAAGLANFTPPIQAALLHRAGAFLPFWIGDKDDFVYIARSDMSAALEWREKMISDYGFEGPMPVCELSVKGELSPFPWGWSMNVISQFKKAGMIFGQEDLLKKRISLIRDLSHRRITAKFYNAWKERGLNLDFDVPEEVSSMENVCRITRQWNKVFVKSPWSSSGRGVFPVSTDSLDCSASRVEGIIRRQGSVMVEQQLNKVVDFAMLFDYDIRPRFIGYSLFFTSTATNYGGNYVASESSIIGKLTQYVAKEHLDDVKESVMAILPELLGERYRGSVGVDMMIYRSSNNNYGIAPCVEINLRFTMGFIAHDLWQRMGREGIMSIVPMTKKGTINVPLQSSIMSEKDAIRLVPENPWFDFRFVPSP